MHTFKKQCYAFACMIVLAAFAMGCNESREAAARLGEDPAASESQMLKDELVGATVAQMLLSLPDDDPDKLRVDVENQLTKTAAGIREYYPEYLTLTAENEEMLRRGTQIPDAAERIANAEKLLNGRELDSGLIKLWLPEHKAGTLTAVRTELLAHMLEGRSRAKQAALAK